MDSGNKLEEESFLRESRVRASEAALRRARPTSSPEWQRVAFEGQQQLNRAIKLEEKRVNTALAEIEKKTEDLEKKIAPLDREIKQVRNKVLEPLAVFVGLFTFASIAFQIFAQVREYILWLPILLVIIGAITVFAGLVIHASSIEGDVGTRRIYTAFIIISGVVLIAFAATLYNKAVDNLRIEESKVCIRVLDSPDSGVKELYCKIKR